MNTELKYKTFDQLLSEVAVDFTMFNTEGMLEPAQLIKVAQRVNYDLGLRINMTKEVVLDICNKKTKLPDDFYVLNYAFLCGQHVIYEPRITGRQTENVILDNTKCTKCGSPDLTCSCQATYTVECKTGEKIYVQVVEKRYEDIRVYKNFSRIYIHQPNSTGRKDATDNSFPSGYIKNGFLYTNLENDAKLFLSYQGALEDDDGNLLVLEHPMINEYYEYALKQRILENMFINGEDVSQKIQLIEQRLRAARNNALSITNTPNFSEMKELWEMNRKAQYSKYYDMFKNYEFVSWIRPGL